MIGFYNLLRKISLPYSYYLEYTGEKVRKLNHLAIRNLC